MTLGRVAVTGANGFVGGRILDHLLASGIASAGIVRAGRALTGRGCPKRELSAWTLGDLTEALQGMDAVVHAASVVHQPGASATQHAAFNVEGTRVLVAAARAQRVRRIVFLSTIKVYGEQPVGMIDESTPTDRSSPYASSKLDAEQILLEAAKQGGPSAVILRLCPVYGQGDKGNVRRVVRAVARRRFVLPGDGSTRKSLAHASTVAEVVQQALQSETSDVFVVSDRVAPSMRELGDIIASALGRAPPPSIPVPVALAVAAGLAAIARLRGREPDVSPELIRKSLRSTICSPAKIERTFGIDCHVELREGVAEEIAWLRREGLV
jgi:nucleoside-diphosphate-sugar epimerase